MCFAIAKLVALAEENYVQHRSVFEQIQRKVQAGAGRRVDFEQASGRLALAESNLLTETANLHDVSARYQRIVGETPPGTLPPAGMFKDVPAQANELQRRRPSEESGDCRRDREHTCGSGGRRWTQGAVPAQGRFPVAAGLGQEP